MQKDPVTVGENLLDAIVEALRVLLHYSVGEIFRFLNQPWGSYPAPKILAVAVFGALIAILISYYLAPIWYALARLGAVLMSLVGLIALFGMFAWASNWFLYAVPNTALAFR